VAREKIGVLLTNLGSPDAPTAGALRRYLAEFLSDRRVVDLPRILWLPLLYGVILNVRPPRSAKLYKRVWTPEGAPLVVIARRQAAAVEQALRTRFDPAPEVALGMRYGNPSTRSALESLRDRGCTRLLVFPLYPQYFSGITGSTFDAVADTLKKWRCVPALRILGDYHDNEAYIASLARSVRETWERDGAPDRTIFSFHGIPVRYEAAGDPYARQCQRTAALLAAALELPYESWLMTFQSRFGREKWLEPYTDYTLRAWAGEGVRRVDVLCPGFSADCLETLEEIAILNRDVFLKAGGERLRYLPALNDRPDHIAALSDLIVQNLAGW